MAAPPGGQKARPGAWLMAASPPLPRLLVLTDRDASERQGRHLPETVAAAVAGGARAVVLREKDLPREARLELGRELLSVLQDIAGTLIIASDATLADELGTGWVHLASTDPLPGRATRLAAGRSCHDAGSLRQAQAERAAYATISPVFASRLKPGYGPSLGLASLAQLAGDLADLPVYALGGVDAATAAQCLTAGAAGVAVMAAVMAADDPAAATRELLTAVEEWRTA